MPEPSLPLYFWSYRWGANSLRNLLPFYTEIPFFNPSKGGNKVSQAVSLCPVPCLGVVKRSFAGELNSQHGKVQSLSDSGDRDGLCPQNSVRNSSNHIPELGHSHGRKLRASNTRIIPSSPYSHHPEKDFFILSLVLLNKKMPRKSSFIDFKRLGQVELVHLAPGCSQHLPGQGTHGISRARQIPAFPSF